MGDFERRKTSGTGMSQSHIGKTNLDLLEAAANGGGGGGVPFVEPDPPAPGGWALWISPGDPAVDPAAGALLAIYTDEMGTVHRKVLAQAIPGPVPPPVGP